MTKELNKNDLLKYIDNTLNELKTAVNTINNKTDLISGIIDTAINLYKNHNDKGGFLRACFSYDYNKKQWGNKTLICDDVIKFINDNNGYIHFNVNTQKLIIDLSELKEITFKEYKKELKDKKIKVNQDKKDYLKNLNIDKKVFLNKNQDYLRACIIYCQDLIKDLNKKDKVKNK